MIRPGLTKGGVVVLYNPSVDDVANIERISQYFDELVVVDNSPVPCKVPDWSGRGITVCVNKNHGGIAGAFNRALEGLQSDPDLVILLDQDSRITLDCIEQLEESAKELGDQPFILGPAVFDVNLGKHLTLPILTKWSYRTERFECLRPGRHRVFAVISSGSVISRKARRILGEFDESFFIDHVDTEYALRAAQHGVPVFMETRAVLQHAIGQRSERRFLGITLRPSNHAPIRRYYIFRNGIILSIRYFKIYPAFFLRNLGRMLHEMVCIILYEHDKFRKIFAIMIAAWDGVRLKSGVASDLWPRLYRKL